MSEQQETAPACLGLVNALKNSLQDLAKQINARRTVCLFLHSRS